MKKQTIVIGTMITVFLLANVSHAVEDAVFNGRLGFVLPTKVSDGIRIDAYYPDPDNPDDVVALPRSILCPCEDENGNYGVHEVEIKIIASAAFKDCSHIRRIVLPDSVEEIWPQAFYGCSSLSEIQFGMELKDIGASAFQNCTNIETINLPPKLKSIGKYAFAKCLAIRELTVPNSVTNIGVDAFWDCDGLEILNASLSVAKIDNLAFSSCNNLSSIILSPLVTLKGTPFSYCNNVTNVVMLGEHLKSISNKNLVSVTLLEGTIEIPNSAFSGCSKLKEIHLPNGLRTIGSWSFYGCSSLQEISMGATVEEIGERAFMDCESLSAVDLNDGLLRIESGAFAGCISLQSLTFPDSVTEIGVTALADCTGLKFVHLPKAIRYISGEMFWGCVSLETVSGLVDGITEIGADAFRGCEKLKSIVLPSNLTTIGAGAFWGCQSLSEIMVPQFVTQIGENAFAGCNRLAQITVASSNKEFSSINGVLYDSDLKKLIMCPMGYNGVLAITNSTVEICDYAAWACNGITEINIPQSVERIGMCAFQGCAKLQSVTIPSSVTTISYYAFTYCDELTAIIFQGRPPAILDSYGYSSSYSYPIGQSDGFYSSLYKDEWNSEISNDEQWHGLRMHELSLTAESADWGTGSITLKATGVSLKEGEEFFLSYCDASAAESDGAQWDYVEDYVSTSDGTGVSFTDTQFSSRLGGIPAVRYRLQIGKSKEDVRATPLYCTTRTRYGIVVGLGKYDKAKYGPRAPTELAQCRNDAKLFEEVMKNEGGIESVNMFPLYDSEGTVENVSKKWKTVANQAVPGDTVFFCMGTHGGSTPMTSGGGLLTAYDGRYLASCLQRDLEPFKSGGRCDGAKVVLILPNCHSEAMVWPYQSAVSSGNILYVTAAAIDEVGITFEGNNPSAYTEFGLFFVKLGLAQHQADEQKTLSGIEGKIFGNQDGAVDLLECAKYSAALDLGKSDVSPSHVQYDSDRAKMMANTILVAGNRKERIAAPDRPNFGENIYLNKVEQGIRINANRCQGVEYLLVRCYAKNEGEYDGTHFQCFIGADIFKTNEFASDDYRRSYPTLQNNVEYCFEAIAVGAGGFSDPGFGYATTENESIKRIISFDANGGTVSETEREVLRGSAIGNLPTPTNGDYQWLGWFKRDGNGNWCEVDANTIVFDSEVYYARWKELELYHTVGFDANGAPVSFAPIVVRAWEPVGDLPEPQWEGHTFVGWFSKYGGHGTQLKAYSMVGRDQIYYAYWTTMPVTYLNSHNAIATASNGDIATAAAMTAANGCRTVGECYALGIDPEDPNDDLKIADFKIEDGKPVITLNHTKDGSGNSFEPRIKTLGKANLTDADWVDVTDKDQSAYRFFKVTVDMP